MTLAAVAATTSAQASVEISSKPTHNMNCTGGVCAPTAKNADLNATDLANMLATGDVTVASQSIAQDIYVNATLNWASSAKLKLDAFRSVVVNRAVEVRGNGALAIETNDGGKNGDYRFFGKGHVKFWNTGSQLEINGVAYLLVQSIRELKKAAKLNDSGHYALAKSIDAAGHAYKYAPVNGIFTGTFEGLGNTISNFTITKDGALIERLCGNTLCSSVIRDLGLIAVNINGSGYSAPLVVWNGGTIANCFATGRISVSGQGDAGGLVTDNSGIIENSYADVAVSGTTAGGLVALNISFGSGEPAVITGSYSLGPVSGYYAGGLVGLNHSYAKIVNSYSFGPVMGSDAGGLVGRYDSSHDAYSLTSSYSTGAVTGDVLVGGLVGDDEVQAYISNTYWDMDASGINDPSRGAGNVPNDPGITGLTEAQLKSGLPAGFDSAIWGHSASINNGYPYLLANPPQ